MEPQKSAREIQKERIAQIEAEASELVNGVNIATLTSINENGYPRTCVMSKYKNEGFFDIYFVSSKRSVLNGKVTHFENNPKASVCCFRDGDSVTLIGNVSFVTDRKTLESIWDESDRRFFGKGLDDPKFRLLKFHTIEATFWIGGKFRTCKYKD
ncbi:MAG: pyridoxamine 5'-phosphate oxidase family protein [Firmicutes bacterium]|nr:pyridoxamine 5'-phosphate oxidase family protein [Bacillota bacterium]